MEIKLDKTNRGELIEEAQMENINIWPRNEKRIWIIMLWLGCGFNYACRVALPMCAVAISKDFGWTKSQIGTVLSSFFWGYTLTQVLGGFLSDKLSGEHVILFSSIGWSLITFITPILLTIFNNSYFAFICLIFSRIIIGCLQGVHYPSVTSILSRRIAEKERSFVFTCTLTGGQFGSVFCGSLGSLILYHYGWKNVIFFIGILSVFWVMVFKYCLTETIKKTKRVLNMQNNLVLSSGFNKSKLKVPWRLLFSKMSFWSIIFSHFCNNNAWFILLTWLPTYFSDTFPTAKGWIFNVVPWLVNIPAAVFSGYLADRMIKSGFSVTFVRKIMAAITLLGSGTFLIFLTFANSFSIALFCMAASVGCSGFHGSGILVNPQDITPQYAGSVFGLMNTAGSIPGFIGVYFTGFILDYWQSWSLVFYITASMCYLGFFVFFIFGTGKSIIPADINMN